MDRRGSLEVGERTCSRVFFLLGLIVLGPATLGLDNRRRIVLFSDVGVLGAEGSQVKPIDGSSTGDES